MILSGGMAGAARPILVAAATWLFWAAGVGFGLGETDHRPPGLPSGGPPSGMLPGQPAPVVIDTALAILEFPAPAQAPGVIHTVQDTVVFGEVFHLILDYPGQPGGSKEIHLAEGEEWLVPVPEAKPGFLDRIRGKNTLPTPDLRGLPAVEDRIRVVRAFRVFRTDPFRIQADSFVSPVIQVLGRVAETGQIAGIRPPRSRGLSLPWILGLLLLLLLVLWLGWLLRNRHGAEDPADRIPPSPAWLAAAIQMRELLQEGYLNRGDSRAFLDGLAGVARRFVAGRYRIAAQEMTGREIITACAHLGYRSAQPGVFARLIDRVDLCRYNPEETGPGWCRDQAVLLCDQIDTVRIMPRYTEVPAEIRREGETAWSYLKRELCSGPDRLRDSAAESAGREA